MSEEQWVPHRPETWPTRYGTLKRETKHERFLGYYKDNRPAMEVTMLPAGTRVKIVMVSRFGDVGITPDLTDERGYGARVGLEDLDNLEAQP